MPMMTNIEKLKIILREKDVPFFDDDELEFYLHRCDDDVDKTAYQCLIIKSENTSLSVSGLNTGDTSAYFRRLSLKYRPNNSGVLKGVY